MNPIIDHEHKLTDRELNTIRTIDKSTNFNVHYVQKKEDNITSKDSFLKIVHLCVNKDEIGLHESSKEALFYCMLEKVYLCE